jgi:WD repeat-containing protein 23
MVEIEEDTTHAETEAETERSELYILFLIQNLLLTLRFAAIRQRRQVMRLLANSEIGRLFLRTGVHVDVSDGEDSDDDDDDYSTTWRRRRRRPKADPNRFPKVPSDEGTELMNSGLFGSSEEHTTAPDGKSLRRQKLASRLLERELATESFSKQRLNQRLMTQVASPSLITSTLY